MDIFYPLRLLGILPKRKDKRLFAVDVHIRPAARYEKEYSLFVHKLLKLSPDIRCGYREHRELLQDVDHNLEDCHTFLEMHRVSKQGVDFLRKLSRKKSSLKIHLSSVEDRTVEYWERDLNRKVRERELKEAEKLFKSGNTQEAIVKKLEATDNEGLSLSTTD